MKTLERAIVQALKNIAHYGSTDSTLVRASKELRTELLVQGYATRPSGGAWILTAKGRDVLKTCAV